VKLENDFDTDVCFQPFPDLKGITMPYVVPSVLIVSSTSIPTPRSPPLFSDMNSFVALLKTTGMKIIQPSSSK
jgi:hypothetical protein